MAQLGAFGLLVALAWAWLYGPDILTIGILAVICILIGYGLERPAPAKAADIPPPPIYGEVVAVVDPTEERLVAMGFRPDEVRPLLAKARALGDPDPAGYVMRSLIR